MILRVFLLSSVVCAVVNSEITDGQLQFAKNIAKTNPAGYSMYVREVCENGNSSDDTYLSLFDNLESKSQMDSGVAGNCDVLMEYCSDPKLRTEKGEEVVQVSLLSSQSRELYAVGTENGPCGGFDSCNDGLFCRVTDKICRPASDKYYSVAGANKACRRGGTTRASDIQVVQTSNCASACMNQQNFKCYGFLTHTNGYCELWKTKSDGVASASGYECFKEVELWKPINGESTAQYKSCQLEGSPWDEDRNYMKMLYTGDCRGACERETDFLCMGYTHAYGYYCKLYKEMPTWYRSADSGYYCYVRNLVGNSRSSSWDNVVTVQVGESCGAQVYGAGGAQHHKLCAHGSRCVNGVCKTSICSEKTVSACTQEQSTTRCMIGVDGTCVEDTTCGTNSHPDPCNAASGCTWDSNTNVCSDYRDKFETCTKRASSVCWDKTHRCRYDTGAQECFYDHCMQYTSSSSCNGDSLCGNWDGSTCYAPSKYIMTADCASLSPVDCFDGLATTKCMIGGDGQCTTDPCSGYMTSSDCSAASTMFASGMPELGACAWTSNNVCQSTRRRSCPKKYLNTADNSHYIVPCDGVDYGTTAGRSCYFDEWSQNCHVNMCAGATSQTECNGLIADGFKCKWDGLCKIDEPAMHTQAPTKSPTWWPKQFGETCQSSFAGYQGECDYGLECVDEGFGGDCRLAQCDTITGSGSCNGESRCFWDTTDLVCRLDHCVTALDVDSCKALSLQYLLDEKLAGCTWDNGQCKSVGTRVYKESDYNYYFYNHDVQDVAPNRCSGPTKIFGTDVQTACETLIANDVACEFIDGSRCEMPCYKLSGMECAVDARCTVIDATSDVCVKDTCYRYTDFDTCMNLNEWNMFNKDLRGCVYNSVQGKCSSARRAFVQNGGATYGVFNEFSGETELDVCKAAMQIYIGTSSEYKTKEICDKLIAGGEPCEWRSDNTCGRIVESYQSKAPTSMPTVAPTHTDCATFADETSCNDYVNCRYNTDTSVCESLQERGHVFHYNYFKDEYARCTSESDLTNCFNFIGASVFVPNPCYDNYNEETCSTGRCHWISDAQGTMCAVNTIYFYSYMINNNMSITSMEQSYFDNFFSVHGNDCVENPTDYRCTKDADGNQVFNLLVDLTYDQCVSNTGYMWYNGVCTYRNPDVNERSYVRDHLLCTQFDGDMYRCNANRGCFYNSFQSKCNYNSCGQITSRGDCGTAANCYWDDGKCRETLERNVQFLLTHGLEDTNTRDCGLIETVAECESIESNCKFVNNTCYQDLCLYGSQWHCDAGRRLLSFDKQCAPLTQSECTPFLTSSVCDWVDGACVDNECHALDEEACGMNAKWCNWDKAQKTCSAEVVDVSTTHVIVFTAKGISRDTMFNDFSVSSIVGNGLQVVSTGNGADIYYRVQVTDNGMVDKSDISVQLDTSDLHDGMILLTGEMVDIVTGEVSGIMTSIVDITGSTSQAVTMKYYEGSQSEIGTSVGYLYYVYVQEFDLLCSLNNDYLLSLSSVYNGIMSFATDARCAEMNEYYVNGHIRRFMDLYEGFHMDIVNNAPGSVDLSTVISSGDDDIEFSEIYMILKVVDSLGINITGCALADTIDDPIDYMTSVVYGSFHGLGFDCTETGYNKYKYDGAVYTRGKQNAPCIDSTQCADGYMCKSFKCVVGDSKEYLNLPEYHATVPKSDETAYAQAEVFMNSYDNSGNDIQWNADGTFEWEDTVFARQCVKTHTESFYKTYAGDHFAKRGNRQGCMSYLQDGIFEDTLAYHKPYGGWAGTTDLNGDGWCNVDEYELQRDYTESTRHFVSRLVPHLYKERSTHVDETLQYQPGNVMSYEYESINTLPSPFAFREEFGVDTKLIEFNAYCSMISKKNKCNSDKYCNWNKANTGCTMNSNAVKTVMCHHISDKENCDLMDYCAMTLSSADTTYIDYHVDFFKNSMSATTSMFMNQCYFNNANYDYATLENDMKLSTNIVCGMADTPQRCDSDKCMWNLFSNTCEDRSSIVFPENDRFYSKSFYGDKNYDANNIIDQMRADHATYSTKLSGYKYLMKYNKCLPPLEITADLTLETISDHFNKNAHFMVYVGDDNAGYYYCFEATEYESLSNKVFGGFAGSFKINEQLVTVNGVGGTQYKYFDDYLKLTRLLTEPAKYEADTVFSTLHSYAYSPSVKLPSCEFAKDSLDTCQRMSDRCKWNYAYDTCVSITESFNMDKFGDVCSSIENIAYCNSKTMCYWDNNKCVMDECNAAIAFVEEDVTMVEKATICSANPNCKMNIDTNVCETIGTISAAQQIKYDDLFCKERSEEAGICDFHTTGKSFVCLTSDSGDCVSKEMSVGLFDMHYFQAMNELTKRDMFRIFEQIVQPFVSTYDADTTSVTIRYLHRGDGARFNIPVLSSAEIDVLIPRQNETISLHAIRLAFSTKHVISNYKLHELWYIAYAAMDKMEYLATKLIVPTRNTDIDYPLLLSPNEVATRLMVLRQELNNRYDLSNDEFLDIHTNFMPYTNSFGFGYRTDGYAEVALQYYLKPYIIPSHYKVCSGNITDYRQFLLDTGFVYENEFDLISDSLILSAFEGAGYANIKDLLFIGQNLSTLPTSTCNVLIEMSDDFMINLYEYEKQQAINERTILQGMLDSTQSQLTTMYSRALGVQVIRSLNFNNDLYVVVKNMTSGLFKTHMETGDFAVATNVDADTADLLNSIGVPAGSTVAAIDIVRTSIAPLRKFGNYYRLVFVKLVKFNLLVVLTPVTLVLPLATSIVEFFVRAAGAAIPNRLCSWGFSQVVKSESLVFMKYMYYANGFLNRKDSKLFSKYKALVRVSSPYAGKDSLKEYASSIGMDGITLSDKKAFQNKKFLVNLKSVFFELGVDATTPVNTEIQSLAVDGMVGKNRKGQSRITNSINVLNHKDFDGGVVTRYKTNKKFFKSRARVEKLKSRVVKVPSFTSYTEATVFFDPKISELENQVMSLENSLDNIKLEIKNMGQGVYDGTVSVNSFYSKVLEGNTLSAELDDVVLLHHNLAVEKIKSKTAFGVALDSADTQFMKKFEHELTNVIKMADDIPMSLYMKPLYAVMWVYSKLNSMLAFTLESVIMAVPRTMYYTTKYIGKQYLKRYSEKTVREKLQRIMIKQYRQSMVKEGVELATHYKAVQDIIGSIGRMSSDEARDKLVVVSMRKTSQSIMRSGAGRAVAYVGKQIAKLSSSVLMDIYDVVDMLYTISTLITGINLGHLYAGQRSEYFSFLQSFRCGFLDNCDELDYTSSPQVCTEESLWNFDSDSSTYGMRDTRHVTKELVKEVQAWENLNEHISDVGVGLNDRCTSDSDCSYSQASKCVYGVCVSFASYLGTQQCIQPVIEKTVGIDDTIDTRLKTMFYRPEETYNQDDIVKPRTSLWSVATDYQFIKRSLYFGGVVEKGMKMPKWYCHSTCDPMVCDSHPVRRCTVKSYNTEDDLIAMLMNSQSYIDYVKSKRSIEQSEPNVYLYLGSENAHRMSQKYYHSDELHLAHLAVSACGTKYAQYSATKTQITDDNGNYIPQTLVVECFNECEGWTQNTDKFKYTYARRMEINEADIDSTLCSTTAECGAGGICVKGGYCVYNVECSSDNDCNGGWTLSGVAPTCQNSICVE